MEKEFEAHSGQAIELAKTTAVKDLVGVKDLEDRYRYDTLLERVEVEERPPMMSQKPHLLRFDSEIGFSQLRHPHNDSRSPKKSGVSPSPINKENMNSSSTDKRMSKSRSKLDMSRDALKKSPQKGTSQTRVSQLSQHENSQDLSERKNTIKSRLLSKLDDL